MIFFLFFFFIYLFIYFLFFYFILFYFILFFFFFLGGGGGVATDLGTKSVGNWVSAEMQRPAISSSAHTHSRKLHLPPEYCCW